MAKVTVDQEMVDKLNEFIKQELITLEELSRRSWLSKPSLIAYKKIWTNITYTSIRKIKRYLMWPN